MCEDVIVNREHEFRGNQSSVHLHAISDGTLTQEACICHMHRWHETPQEEVKPQHYT